jgi:multisubunit Na+/H+ antiporter MnhG subunit
MLYSPQGVSLFVSNFLILFALIGVIRGQLPDLVKRMNL